MINALIILCSSLLITQANEIQIQGKVFDGDTHKPITEAVILLNVNDEVVRKTRADGIFQLNLNLDTLKNWHKKNGHINPGFYNDNMRFLLNRTIFSIHANGYKTRYLTLRNLSLDSIGIDMYINSLVLRGIDIGDTLSKVDKAEMVWVKGGRLDSAAAPRNFVFDQNVDDLYVDKYLVTVNDYARFVQESGYVTDNETLLRNNPELDVYTWQQDDVGKMIRQKHFDRPVINISFDDAMAYARWYGKRLPTYLEWQYLALKGLKGIKYNDVSWNCFNSKGKIREVGEKGPDALGLYDLYGNVSEVVFYYDSEKELKNYTNSGLYNNYKQQISMGGNAFTCVTGPFVTMQTPPFKFSSRSGFRCVY